MMEHGYPMSHPRFPGASIGGAGAGICLLSPGTGWVATVCACLALSCGDSDRSGRAGSPIEDAGAPDGASAAAGGSSAGGSSSGAGGAASGSGGRAGSTGGTATSTGGHPADAGNTDGGSPGSGGSTPEGGAECGAQACAAAEVCIARRVVGGGILFPDDSGACPAGSHPEPIGISNTICASDYTYQCVPLMGCSPGAVQCSCAAGTCPQGYGACSDPSPSRVELDPAAMLVCELQAP